MMRIAIILATVLALVLGAAIQAADLPLRWTIQPDDATHPENGPASGYVLYYGIDSAAVVDAASADHFDTVGTVWDIVEMPGVPGQVGDTVTYTVDGITPDVYWFFTMKSYDNVGNRSLLGNIVKYRFEDVERPGTVFLEIIQ